MWDSSHNPTFRLSSDVLAEWYRNHSHCRNCRFSFSASKFFISALGRKEQLLVAYPRALLYEVFALISIF